MQCRSSKKGEAADWPHLILGSNWIEFLRATRCRVQLVHTDIHRAKKRRYGDSSLLRGHL